MPNRSAGSAIQGYIYQFDYTILQILNSGDDTVVVEGLEDVDIHSDTGSLAVQVKYLESGHYATPATLRKPIMLMLDALAAGAQYDFILHVYFGDGSKPPTHFTPDELRECLTEQKRLPKPHIVKHYENYSNETIEAFATKLTIRPGLARDEQLQQVIASLATALSCHPDDSSELHYGNALRYVQDRAMAKDEADRRVIRADFLLEINKRVSLYTRWHAEVVGRERYVTALAKRLKAEASLRATRIKAIELSVPIDPDRFLHLTELIEYLATTAYGVGRLSNTKAWTIILHGSANQILRLKVELLARGVNFADGFEDISFQPEIFARLPVLNCKGSKISKTSYDVRIMNIDSFRAFRSAGHQLDVIVVTTDIHVSELKAGSKYQHVEFFGLEYGDIKKIVEVSR